MKIVKEGAFEWQNRHQTYKQNIQNLYDIANEPSGDALDVYNDTTRGIQGIISDAISSNTLLRALGGNWSLSTITATSGIILNTQNLNIVFPIGADHKNAQYTGDTDDLFLAQCGTSMWELSATLEQNGRSLRASGASNGQTIAGAIATGTHGAGILYGAIQDSVVGLHIITSPTTSIWLERKSNPIMDDSFAGILNATTVRDDAAFNAALVSFGAFGFVHGVMVQAKPIYLLEAYLRRVPFDSDLQQQVINLSSFNYARLPYPGTTPFHFGVLINPYDVSNGVYMTVMYEAAYTKDYTPPKPNGAGIGPGDDAPCFIGQLSDVAPALVPALANVVIGKSLTPYEKQFGTLAQIFNNTLLRGKLASAAVGFDPQHAWDVMNMLLDLNKTAGPFVGVFAFRFVKSSQASMAFTRFGDYTCVLELDGVQSLGTLRFYDAVWAGLEQRGINYTFHWGKMNTLTADKIQAMYGQSLTDFLQQRTTYVDAATLKVFSNDTLRNWGIDEAGNIPTTPPAPMIV